jgi:hypothetical protein
VGVHRSRYELERVLGRYGATDFAFVEADANAAIQFAMDGRYVQVALPLPDPTANHFTHTPSGRPRPADAQERAYEQALREHWRALLLAVRGKLQSVESGISRFEDEFSNFLVPHFQEDPKKARRRKPKAVNWLLGSSHSLAIALVAAFLVPASAVGAFALPPSVVDHLAAPFRGALPDELGVPSDHARAVALGQSIWLHENTQSHDNRPVPNARRGFAATMPESEATDLASSSDVLASSDIGGLRQGAEGSVSGGTDSAPSGQGGPPASSGAPAPGGGKQAGESASAPEDSDGDVPAVDAGEPAEGSDLDDTPAAAGDPGDSEESGAPGDSSPEGETPESAEASNVPEAEGDAGSQSGDSGSGHDNGNHNGADNGNKNGADNGNGNGNGNGKKDDAPAPPAPGAPAPPAENTGNGNGNKNGADNGNKNGADNGSKADAPAGDQPKPGKGDPKAGH